MRALVRRTGLSLPTAVETVVGDLADTHALAEALDGVTRVFMATSPDPDQVALQRNLVAAARDAGVGHLVRVSILGAAPDSPIALRRWHFETEQEIERSGIPYTHLRPVGFMQNLLAQAGAIATAGAVYAPAGEGRIASVDARDVAAIAVATLTSDRHHGRTYSITGPAALTYGEMAAVLSTELGVPVAYVNVPPEAARQGMIAAGMPAWCADDYVALDEKTARGDHADVRDTAGTVGGEAPISFAQFVRDHRAQFLGR